jgi:hypothetical protein
MPDALLIRKYGVAWNSDRKRGHVWFTYYNGERHRTAAWGLDADSIRILVDILRNEKPVFGDHTTGTVVTSEEEVGEEERQVIEI